MIRVMVNGILGRMGQELCTAILRDSDLFLAGGVDTLETFHCEEIFVSTDPLSAVEETDVVIDFSSGEGAAAIVKACKAHNKPLVTGTTGLSADQQAAIAALAEKVAVVQTFNFSIGINLLAHVLAQVTEVLGGDFDAEIIDVHHRNKKDSPSGTALMLARTINQAMKRGADEHIQFGRKGKQMERGPEIALHSLRGGSVIGEHQVHLFTQQEEISLTHRAVSRRSFVGGALRATHWIITQSAGLYSMQDVLVGYKV